MLLTDLEDDHAERVDITRRLRFPPVEILWGHPERVINRNICDCPGSARGDFAFQPIQTKVTNQSLVVVTDEHIRLVDKVSDWYQCNVQDQITALRLPCTMSME